MFTIDDENQKEKRKDHDGGSIGKFAGGRMFSAYFVFDENGKYREKTILTSDKGNRAIQGTRLEPVSDGVYMALGSTGHNKKKSYPVKVSFSLEE